MGKFKNLQNLDISKALLYAGQVVERDAREKCPLGNSTNHLRDSIHTRVEDNSAIIGTNTFYAPYVEFGTGGRVGGRSGWWVYVDPIMNAPKGDNTKRYSYQEACRIYASLIKLYGQDHVHLTDGQLPHPFLQPALLENREQIYTVFKEQIDRQLKGE